MRTMIAKITTVISPVGLLGVTGAGLANVPSAFLITLLPSNAGVASVPRVCLNTSWPIASLRAYARTVAKSENALPESVQAALDDIAQIAKDIENESNIETLIEAKGFEECIAVISDGKATVIVQTDGLLASEVAQINEIVYEQSGILPTELKIIEKN